MSVNDAFSNSGYNDVGTPFDINLGGFINPRTMDETDTFVITTKDGNGNELETIETGVTV